MDSLEGYRQIIFASVLFLCIIFETIKPLFAHHYKKRLVLNFIIFLSAVVVMKFCFPFGIYKLASKITEGGNLFGFYKMPFYLDLIVTVLVFDLAIYWQHRFFHIFKYLWKFHTIHHCDKSMDFSNALRFHPGEIVLSGVYKLALILLFLPRAETFLIYEMILSSMALFNHSNISIRPSIDNFLRLFIVTPSMHYPHHSPKREYTNSNYGNFLSMWDRIFKTYTPDKNSEFGLDDLNDQQVSSLKEQLFFPFK